MLDNQTKAAIDGLFEKLSQVERSVPQRDAEAEDLIGRRVASQPGAPYYMAQTIVVQEKALEDAQRRIAELERAPASAGGFFGFGGRRNAPDARQPMPQAAPAQGSGFLGSAAQTAMGVAGGMLLANAIGGMFGGGEAEAATAAPETPAEPDADAGADEGGFFDDFFGGGEE